MAIETICAGCSKMLRVADEHAGKKARCPHCGNVYDVPQVAVTPAVSEMGASRQGEWFLRTPEGKTYGPVTYEELLSWRREGRLVAGSELRHGDSQEWFPASQQFPDLQIASDAPTQNSGHASANPFGEPAANPYASPVAQSYDGRTHLRPHRGQMILTLGLVSWAISCVGSLVCGPFALPGVVLAIMAWVMGAADLREMQAGRMDPAGESSTRIGMISGIVFCVLSILAVIGAVLFVIMAVVMDL